MDRADRDDDFARILDDERAIRDSETDPETAQPAPAPAPPIETPAQSETIQATGEGSTVEQSADEKATAAAAFQAALNNLNSDDAKTIATEDAADPDVAEASAADTAATVANTAKPAAAATAAASAAQANAALLVLAGAGGAPTAPVALTDDAEDADSTDDPGTGEGAAIAALAGVPQSATSQAAGQAAGAASPGNAGVKSAAQDTAGAAPLPAGITADGDASAATTKDGKSTDVAQAQSANPATSPQTNAHPAANAATQANAVAAAAASTDGAVQAATNTNSAASQAAQPASTTSSLTDAARTAPTPPALQSAPPATIQVYARMIERADGRAQRFEVRLDPAELGRVDIRIEIGADRKVHAVMAAHDSAALTDLMRGQKSLERALSDAGIDLAENGLRFEIAADAGRGGASQQRDGDASGRSSQPDAWRKFDTASIPVSAEAAAAATPTRRTQRLDLVA